MQEIDPNEVAPEVEGKCTVSVLYEDGPTHERARQLCDRLLNRFWGDVEFDLTWWSFDCLRDNSLAQAAARAARKAHLILFSTHAGQRLPATVQTWIESWVTTRQKRGGALAALIGVSEEQGVLPIAVYLRQVAERAQMEFLPQLTPHTTDPLLVAAKTTFSQEAYVTATLKRWLDPQQPSSHWGINE